MGRFVAIVLVFVALAGPASATGLIEEDITLTATFEGRRARAVLDLEALVVRPDDGLPHPLVVLNHGAPRQADDRPGMHPRRHVLNAREFARRGWVVVVPMRRGYGQSEGEYVESSGRCDDPDYLASARASAEDVRQVIARMAEMPYVDASKTLVVGQSAGGLATVALTASPPPGVVAAINFAGGRGSTKPDHVGRPERLVDAFAVFGRTSRVPMLWVYTDNDRYFAPQLARRFHEAFTEAGGNARLIAAPPFGEDGHMLFSDKGIPIWTRYVEEFLAAQRLTQFERPLPPRDVSRIAYPKGLSESGRAAFAKYLEAPSHKAFVMSPSGAFGWRSGQRSLDEAVEQAVELCAKHAGKRCRTMMINDENAP